MTHEEIEAEVAKRTDLSAQQKSTLRRILAGKSVEGEDNAWWERYVAWEEREHNHNTRDY